MAITYVGNGRNGNSTLSLSGISWEAGDLAIFFAERVSTTQYPSLPSGWTNIYTTEAAADGVALRAAYRFLQSGDTTWSLGNTDQWGVVVYRGAATTNPVLTYGAGKDTVGSSTFVIQACGKNTSSLAVSLGLCITDLNLDELTATGWTNRTSGGNGQWGVAEKATGTDIAATNYTMSGSERWMSITVTLRDATSLFPYIADLDTTSGTVTSNSSSWTLTYPTNIASGDLLIALVSKDGGSGVPSVGGGSYWNGDTSGANGLYFALRRCDGTETGTFTLDVGASEQGSWLIYRIPAGTWYDYLGTGSGWPSTTSYDHSFGVVTGASTTPDPPSLNPINWDAENTLWIAVMGADTSRTVSAYPSSPDTFTNTGSLVSGGSNGATLAWGRLEKNASSVDPGTFTISNSDDWVAATIAIRPAAQLPKSLPPSRPLRHPLIYR